VIRPYYNLDDDGRAESRYYSYGGGRRFGGGLTPGLKWIIFSCIAVFILQLMLKSRSSALERTFIEWLGYTPALAFGKLRLWQPLTYMFVHGNFLHILFNMFFLWMIGGFVEGRLGAKRFVWLFILSGVAGAVLQGLVVPDHTTIGASAGVMGVAAACAVLYPNMTVLVFFVFPMKMKYFVILLAIIDIMAASGGGQGVAYFAHLAGLGAGYLFIRFEPRATFALKKLYYRLTRRFRGFKRPAGSVEIDDEQEYRREVDRILDKIFRESTASLTDDENEFLKKASKRFKK
jgi:membrane associated rhomboid family serine protease